MKSLEFVESKALHEVYRRAGSQAFTAGPGRRQPGSPPGPGPRQARVPAGPGSTAGPGSLPGTGPLPGPALLPGPSPPPGPGPPSGRFRRRARVPTGLRWPWVPAGSSPAEPGSLPGLGHGPAQFPDPTRPANAHVLAFQIQFGLLTRTCLQKMSDRFCSHIGRFKCAKTPVF